MSPYTKDTTAEEVAADCQSRIANKTILVTGASPGGLGATFASIIANYGPAGVILATRDLSKAEATAKEIAIIAPKVRTWSIELDLGSREQIKKAAEQINSLGEHIDVIVNNAGIMAPPFSKTVDGIESQFGTNHIGHFLLTNLLLPSILSKNVPVRVVNVSSNGFRFGPPRFEDWNFDDGKTYNRWIAYGQSKSANMLFSVGLANKLGKQGLVSVSLHPGVIMTGLGRNLQMEDFEEFVQLDRTLGYRSVWDKPHEFKTPSQGVATHVFAAFHPSLDSPELNGSNLTDVNVVDPKLIQSWARDSIDAERLWDLSEKLVGQEFKY
ncbi:Fc.00g072420.m01.CDS01 [Cosmosporella sp. VM-42]